MEVQIEFTLNASELGGKALVTFEELYNVLTPENLINLTEDKCIKNEGQLATITKSTQTKYTVNHT